MISVFNGTQYNIKVGQGSMESEIDRLTEQNKSVKELIIRFRKAHEESLSVVKDENNELHQTVDRLQNRIKELIKRKSQRRVTFSMLNSESEHESECVKDIEANSQIDTDSAVKYSLDEESEWQERYLKSIKAFQMERVQILKKAETLLEWTKILSRKAKERKKMIRRLKKENLKLCKFVILNRPQLFRLILAYREKLNEARGLPVKKCKSQLKFYQSPVLSSKLSLRRHERFGKNILNNEFQSKNHMHSGHDTNAEDYSHADYNDEKINYDMAVLAIKESGIDVYVETGEKSGNFGVQVDQIGIDAESETIANQRDAFVAVESKMVDSDGQIEFDVCENGTSTKTENVNVASETFTGIKDAACEMVCKAVDFGDETICDGVDLGIESKVAIIDKALEIGDRASTKFVETDLKADIDRGEQCRVELCIVSVETADDNTNSFAATDNLSTDSSTSTDPNIVDQGVVTVHHTSDGNGQTDSIELQKSIGTEDCMVDAMSSTENIGVSNGVEAVSETMEMGVGTECMGKNRSAEYVANIKDQKVDTVKESLDQSLELDACTAEIGISTEEISRPTFYKQECDFNEKGQSLDCDHIVSPNSYCDVAVECDAEADWNRYLKCTKDKNMTLINDGTSLPNVFDASASIRNSPDMMQKENVALYDMTKSKLMQSSGNLEESNLSEGYAFIQMQIGLLEDEKIDLVKRCNALQSALNQAQAQKQSLIEASKRVDYSFGQTRMTGSSPELRKDMVVHRVKASIGKIRQIMHEQDASENIELILNQTSRIKDNTNRMIEKSRLMIQEFECERETLKMALAVAEEKTARYRKRILHLSDDLCKANGNLSDAWELLKIKEVVSIEKKAKESGASVEEMQKQLQMLERIQNRLSD